VNYDRLSSYEAFLDDHEVAPHSKKPASLVGQPEALASEVFEMGKDSFVEGETPVATAEFGCQLDSKR